MYSYQQTPLFRERKIEESQNVRQTRNYKNNSKKQIVV